MCHCTKINTRINKNNGRSNLGVSFSLQPPQLNSCNCTAHSHGQRKAHLISDQRFFLLTLHQHRQMCVCRNISVQSECSSQTHTRTQRPAPCRPCSALRRGQWLLTCYYYTVVQHTCCLQFSRKLAVADSGCSRKKV